MKVFKFGGASVKDAKSVENISTIISDYQNEKLLIVISAMGKTTNSLEDLLNTWWKNNKQSSEEFKQVLQHIKKYHFDIINDLLPNNHTMLSDEIENYFINLEHTFHKCALYHYDQLYDQVVSYGELISTKIVSYYLNTINVANKWIDARNFIITDDIFREARVNWAVTTQLIKDTVGDLFQQKNIILTQGFIGSTQDNMTVTLGREGSDYTASIFANCLEADEVVIWKDVAGVLNADPKKYPYATKFQQLSYEDAVEMTYYGARVLHPKTIKPLQNKSIPLHVRSFIDPKQSGTYVLANIALNQTTPVIIFQENQLLISLSTKDYSFIAEENIKIIFDEVVKNGIRVNIMSNSAISFQITVDNMAHKVSKFIDALNNQFNISITEGLQIITIKNPSEEIINEVTMGKEISNSFSSKQLIQYLVSA